ncbi:MAG: glutathione S-transferase N-terminal domain-containing protein [Bdellovibrionales bacterium]|nr:glutathione S-transferase N-terminal domain-containing protein [Bdellovibrionales bacterium]
MEAKKTSKTEMPQDASLKLYYFEACPYCQKVLHVIDRLDIKSAIEFLDTRSEPKHREALIQLTGKTQVPCLEIDGKPLLESEDIVTYLIQRFAC